MLEVGAAPSCDLGEGPVWDPRRDLLVWVDLPAGLVHELDPDEGSSRTIAIGQPVSAVLAEGNGWLLCTELGFQTRDHDWQLGSAVDILDPAARVRMNDAALDPFGRCFGGTLSLDDEPGRGIFFRVDGRGAVEVIADGVGISNGIAWSPDGRILYHVDSLAGVVYRRSYDPDTGLVGDATVLFSAKGSGGLPDGIAVDAAGCLWVAFWDGGVIRRINPQGQVVDTLGVPASRPTSVAFGGWDLRTLYITTAQDDSGAGGQLYEHPTLIPGLRISIPHAQPDRIEGLRR